MILPFEATPPKKGDVFPPLPDLKMDSPFVPEFAPELHRFLNMLLAENSIENPENVAQLEKDLKKVFVQWVNKGILFAASHTDSLVSEIFIDHTGDGEIGTPNIALFRSSTEVMRYIAKIVLKKDCEAGEKKQKVFLVSPTYFGLKDVLNGCEIEEIKTSLNDGFAITKDVIGKVKEALENGGPDDVLWICSPNNPTGISWTLHDLEEVLKSAKGYVIVDQAFLDSIDPDNKNSAAQLIKKYPKLIVTRTFSKAVSPKSDLDKVGIAIADPSIVKVLEEMRKADKIALSEKSLRLAIESLKYVHQLRMNAAELKRKIEYFYAQLKLINEQYGFLFEASPDSETGVLLLRLTMSRVLFEYLEKYNVAVLNTNEDLGIFGELFVRICLGDFEQVVAFLDRLVAIAKELQPAAG